MPRYQSSFPELGWFAFLLLSAFLASLYFLIPTPQRDEQTAVLPAASAFRESPPTPNTPKQPTQDASSPHPSPPTDDHEENPFLPSYRLQAQHKLSWRAAHDAEIKMLSSWLAYRVRRWIRQDRLARPNGYLYAVELGQMLTYTARCKQKLAYQHFRKLAKQHFIRDLRSDPYTKGFVLWRYSPKHPADASGTTEALRIAQGLWLGHQAYGDKQDRLDALVLLDGYRRHAYVDNGIWLIRNYFNFQTRSFSPNSYLIDYAPDFLTHVATATQDAKLAQTARLSYETFAKAQAPSGLFYDVIQPEIRTLLPASLVYFSPNDVIKLQNSLAVAEEIALGARERSQRVLRFALSRLSDLNAYYYGRDGQEAMLGESGAVVYASLLRLAYRLQDTRAQERIFPYFLAYARQFIHVPYEPKTFIASEILLAFDLLNACPPPLLFPHKED